MVACAVALGAGCWFATCHRTLAHKHMRMHTRTSTFCREVVRLVRQRRCRTQPRATCPGHLLCMRCITTCRRPCRPCCMQHRTCCMLHRTSSMLLPCDAAAVQCFPRLRTLVPTLAHARANAHTGMQYWRPMWGQIGLPAPLRCIPQAPCPRGSWFFVCVRFLRT